VAKFRLKTRGRNPTQSGSEGGGYCRKAPRHDLSGKERFRFFLSDEGYRNAKCSEQEEEIKIKSHAAIVAGKLYPDKKPRQ
jgi:hypothetical protein